MTTVLLNCAPSHQGRDQDRVLVVDGGPGRVRDPPERGRGEPAALDLRPLERHDAPIHQAQRLRGTLVPRQAWFNIILTLGNILK